MKRLSALLIMGIVFLMTFSSCENDEDIHFVFSVGFPTANIDYSEYSSVDYLKICPIAVGYYYGDSYDLKKVRFIKPENISITVEGEGFGFTDLYMTEISRMIRIEADVNTTTETRYGKMIVTVSKGGKTESIEVELKQLPEPQE